MMLVAGKLFEEKRLALSSKFFVLHPKRVPYTLIVAEEKFTIILGYKDNSSYIFNPSVVKHRKTRFGNIGVRLW